MTEIKDADFEVLKKKSIEHAKKSRIRLNPEEKIVNGVLKALLKNKDLKGELFCPCRVVSGNKERDAEIICPCVFHRGEIELQGKCHCNLFVQDNSNK